MSENVLEVEKLRVDYVSPQGLVHVVDDVSLVLKRGEVHGLVGESGCGKSTLARSLLRVLGPPAVISGGSVRLEGQDLLQLDARQLDQVRWVKMAIVFQGAIDALNPVLRIEEQLVDALAAHGVKDTAEARRRAAKLLDRVSLPARVLRAFPHELSGGMRQRVVIAMALALGPKVLLMDEPTTALDVVVQAEILDELDRLRRDMGFAVLLVSHDLPLMLERCSRISVMYAGRIVESGPVDAFRGTPSHPYAQHLLGHPYAQHLLQSFPKLDGPRTISRALTGSPPSLFSPPPGCRFHPRCSAAMPICSQQQPALQSLGENHVAACHLIDLPVPASAEGQARPEAQNT
jgi:peptide/nickel transport system ATP-binding protein